MHTSHKKKPETKPWATVSGFLVKQMGMISPVTAKSYVEKIYKNPSTSIHLSWHSPDVKKKMRYWYVISGISLKNK